MGHQFISLNKKLNCFANNKGYFSIQKLLFWAVPVIKRWPNKHKVTISSTFYVRPFLYKILVPKITKLCFMFLVWNYFVTKYRQKALAKCWWNWLKVSISPMFYEQLLQAETWRLVSALAIAAFKTLVKLTPGWNLLSWWQLSTCFGSNTSSSSKFVCRILQRICCCLLWRNKQCNYLFKNLKKIFLI